MKKYLRAAVIIAVMLSALVLTSCGKDSSTQGSDTQMKPVYWTMGTHQSAATNYIQQDIDFAEAVKERTNGLVNITVYAAGELPYNATEFAQLVSDGTIEMAAVPSSYIAGECPTSAVSAWPMLAGAIDEVNPALEAADPYVKAELNAKNIEVVGSQAYPMQTMFGSGKAPKTLDDLKGLKMRVFDPYQADLLAAIGVSPVSMVMSEVPSSMQKNVINSSLTGVIGAYEAKWYDICDWAYLMPVAASNCYMIINKSLLDGLPADIRQIIYEEGEKYTEAVNAYNEEAIPNAAKRLEENGVTVVYPSEEDIKKMETIAADFWESWSNDYTDNVKECYKAIKSALNK